MREVEEEVDNTYNRELLNLKMFREFELGIVENELISRSGSKFNSTITSLILTVIVTYVTILFGYIGTFVNSVMVTVINYELNNDPKKLEGIELNEPATYLTRSLGKYLIFALILVAIIVVIYHVLNSYKENSLVMKKQVIKYELETIEKRIERNKRYYICKHFANMRGTK